MDIAKWSFNNLQTPAAMTSRALAQKAVVAECDDKWFGGVSPQNDDHFAKNAVDTHRDGCHIQAKFREADAPYLGGEYFSREDHKSNVFFEVQGIVSDPAGKEIATTFARTPNGVEGTELTKWEDGTVHGFRFHGSYTGRTDDHLTKSYFKANQAKEAWGNIEDYILAGKEQQPWHDVDRPGSGWLSPY